MFLYIARNTSPRIQEAVANRAGANHFLFTFKGAQKCAQYFCAQPQRRIFIDSGAFSVWKNSKSNSSPVKLREYIAFCKEILDKAKCPVVFAALDVIPGKPKGPNPTQRQKERACEEGWDNYLTMKQEHIPCLMTFHQFEHVRWLAKIADDSDYFAVSPRKSGVSNEDKLNWLGQVFKYIGPFSKSNGELRLKKNIHGLGVSSADYMKQFPFFSVDNTTAFQSTLLHSRRNLDGKYMTLGDWERLARRDGVPTKFLRGMLGYGIPGELPELDGQSGSYWLLCLGMQADVEMERRVTKHWRDRGLVLDEEPPKNTWEIASKNGGPASAAEVAADLKRISAEDFRRSAILESQVKDPENRRWLGLKEN